MPSGVREQFIEVGDTKIQLLTGGSGAPLLLLHGTEGNLGWLRYAQALAEHFTVYLPAHPGFNQSERPAWLKTITDLVCFYTWFLEQQGLEGVPAIGFSLGGWLAAELVATTRHAFSKLMLVDAVGLKPQQGEIADIFIMSPAQVTERSFYDPQQAPEYNQIYGHPLSPEQQESAERNREMAVRLCWKPYMHDPRLPALLARVAIPTRLVWGRQDALVPLECGQLYQQAIPGSELVVIEQCGHLPQLEKPEEFVHLALEFLLAE
jgi:pimeloyl-ACP methyl ester carboxylesterase